MKFVTRYLTQPHGDVPTGREVTAPVGFSFMTRA
ncbi:hypothetical protein HDE77_002306 [Rhodanobacter sp. MP7CTX1]|nr:hypothetical protein [Rhodanobacter sp. MP7CTX1]